MFNAVPVTAEMSDFVVMKGEEATLNVNALREAGKALLNGQQASVPDAAATTSNIPVQPTQAKVTEQPNPVQQTQQPQQPVAAQPDSTNPQFVDLPDNQMVKVLVNGKEVIKPWGQAKKEVMLHSKFTQESQQLAQQRSEFETQRTTLAERAAMAEKLETLVTRPDLLLKYIQANPQVAQVVREHFGVQPQQPVQPQVPAQPFGRPADEVVNFAELDAALQARGASIEERVSALLEARASQFENIVNERVKTAISTLEDAREVNAFNQEINKTISAIVEANPALKVIPQVNQLMRAEVARMNPGSPKEMLEAFDIVARGIVEQLDNHYQTSRAASLAAAEELKTGGLEPSRGQAPNTTIQPNALDYRGADGKVDLKKLNQLGKAYLASLQGR